jgi:ribosomal subunit interface protein
MNVTVKGKQIDVGDALRTYVNDNLGHIVKKYFPNSIDGQVVFARDAHTITTDIQLNVGRGLVVQSHGAAAEPYPSFDDSLEKISRQLQRYKKRLEDEHHRKEAVDEAIQHASSYVLNTKDDSHITEAQPLVIAEMQTSILSLSVSEAVMHLDLSNVPALLFKNRGNGAINMVYRRPDGNIGWVDPANTTLKAKV